MTATVWFVNLWKVAFPRWTGGLWDCVVIRVTRLGLLNCVIHIELRIVSPTSAQPLVLLSLLGPGGYGEATDPSAWGKYADVHF